MKEEFEKQLDALFDDAKARATKAQDKKNAEAEAQKDFVAAFVAKRSDVVIPTLEDFAKSVARGGWTAQLKVQEDSTASAHERGRSVMRETAAAAGLTFYRGEGRGGDSYPSFSVSADKRGRKVQFYSSTMGPGHGGSASNTGSTTLDALTGELLQEKLVAYFKSLMNDARPYDER